MCCFSCQPAVCVNKCKRNTWKLKCFLEDVADGQRSWLSFNALGDKKIKFVHCHTGLGRGQGAREGGKRIKPQDDVDDEAVDVRSRV